MVIPKPTLEIITRTSRCIGNINRFVDIQCSVRIITLTVLADSVTRTIILVPDDKGGHSLIDIHKNRTKLDGVGSTVDDNNLVAVIVQSIMLNTFVIYIGLVVPSRAVIGDDSAGIAFENGERCAGLHGLAGVTGGERTGVCDGVTTDGGSAIPRFDYPVGEAHPSRSSGGGMRNNLGTIQIHVEICKGHVVAIHHILDCNTLGTFGGGVPLTV